MTLRRSVSRLAAVLAVVALVIFSAACGDDNDGPAPPDLSDTDATGRALADEFMVLLQQLDTDQLEAFLSDAFIIQRADGSTATKAEYLTRLPEIREYEIVSAMAMQSGGALTVRWEVAVDQTIDGTHYSGAAAPRLSVFQWDGAAERWRLAGHANFNVPEQ